MLIDSGCAGDRTDSDEHALATTTAIANKTTLRMQHLSEFIYEL
jgi:hypothetical protein